jgi:hypothetical protein
MLQRIQSLYMLGTVIACLSLFFLPIVSFTHPMQGDYILYASGMKYMIDPPVIVNFWLTFPMLVLVIASILMTSAAIFLFKKRPIQLWLVNINFLVHVALIMLIFFLYINRFESQFNTLAAYKVGVFIPLVSLVLLILASKAIRKDEALVKSAERIR